MLSGNVDVFQHALLITHASFDFLYRIILIFEAKITFIVSLYWTTTKKRLSLWNAANHRKWWTACYSWVYIFI